jgi:hypothetical protein
MSTTGRPQYETLAKLTRLAGTCSRTRDGDALIFQPWFLPNKTSRAIRHLIPQGYQMRMIDYFAQFGCMRCDKREVPYGGNGFCKPCRGKLQHRLWRCIKRRAAVVTPNRYGLKYLADVRNARKLLKGFPANMYVGAQSHPGSRYKINNPARDGFIVVDDYAGKK